VRCRHECNEQTTTAFVTHGIEKFGMNTNPEESITELFLEPAEQGHLVHDMKSPFNGIVGLTEPMAKLAKEPEKKKQLTWINVCGARWCKHIESTIDANLLASGLVDLRGDTFNVGFMVQEACALMTVAKDPRDQYIKKESVVISNSVPAEGLTVVGSDPHTSKCIYHLLMNAIKFTDAGSVSVSHRMEGDSHIVIEIADTGIGIPESEMQNIFLPFRRLHNDRLPGESLGLGLSSTKEYIEFVGGKVILKSCVGKGTNAELWVPKNASNIGQYTRGPIGFGYWGEPPLISKSGPWLLQKRALGILAVDLLAAHFGIAGMSEILINNEPKAPAKKQLGMIQRSANRVIEVLSLVRDSTLLSEPLIVFRHLPIKIAQVLDTIFGELNKALDKRGQPMKKKTVEFINDSAGLETVITSDPFYFYRMVYQLCDNALKFTNEGKVNVQYNETGVEIVDTGCGFDSTTKLSEIFKAFHRLEPETYYGIGLGLNMVRDIEKKIGATIVFESEKGKGSRVRIQFENQAGKSQASEEKPIQVEHTNPVPLVVDVKEDKVVVESIPVQAVEAPVETVLTEKIPVEQIEETPLVQEESKKVKFDDKTESMPEPTIEIEKPKEAEAVVPVEIKKQAEVPKVTTEAPQQQQPEAQQFTYADMPKEEEETEMIKRKTLAGDKYRLLVEMEDGTEQPTLMGSLGHLNLAIEVLKERTAVAQSMSENIKSTIKKLEARNRV
jgi:signal transduction histidine kinase